MLSDFSKCTHVLVTPQLLHPLWLPVFFRVKCYSWRCPRSHPAASQGRLWAPEPGLLGWHWRWVPALYWLAPEDVLSGCPPPLHAVGALGAGLLMGGNANQGCCAAPWDVRNQSLSGAGGFFLFL